MKRVFSQIRFRTSLYSIIGACIVLSALVQFGIVWRESREAAAQASAALFAAVSGRVGDQLTGLLEGMRQLTMVAAESPGLIIPPDAPDLVSVAQHPAARAMLAALKAHRQAVSVYVGHGDGDFLQAVNLRGDRDLLARYEAPEDAVFLLRAIRPDAAGRRMENRVYLDGADRPILESWRAAQDYDPRVRPWYQAANASQGPVFTDPYVFSLTRGPGVTCAARLHDAAEEAVFGVDLSLADFAIYLATQRVSPGGLVFLLDAQGRLVAHPDAALHPTRIPAGQELVLPDGETAADPLLRLASRLSKAAAPDTAFQRQELLDGAPRLLAFTPAAAKMGLGLTVVVTAPRADFEGHIAAMRRNTLLASLALLGCSMPLAWLLARRISKPLERMEVEARRIHQFNFAETPRVSSHIEEIDSLGEAFHHMKSEIRLKTEALLDTQGKLEQLVDRGIALSAERDMKTLLEIIFLAAKDLTSADGGVLYLLDKERRLHFELLRIDSMDLALGGPASPPPPFPPVDMTANADCDQARHAAACQAARTGGNIVQGAGEKETVFAMPELGEEAAYLVETQVTVPLRTRSGEVIGVLQLMNARDEDTWETIPFGGRLGFVESLASQAAVALDNQRLLAEINTLFDAFIQIIAGAIDAKSPYTGGHCQRVPVIANRLARIAHEAADGPLKDFRFETEDQWREFHIAAWLHDCGKVTTPEYVVDKATKLETIRNRIHEIRMRFEVLLRDAEIDALSRMQSPGADMEAIRQELESLQSTLHEEFAFVARCNIGGEFLSDEAMARLHAIAQRTWERRLDDTLGISDDERRRLPPDHPAAPVQEPLLADKPEHVIPREAPPSYLGNGYRIRMQVPEHLYNLGELHNLAVRRGTLTTEDRFKIQEHVIQTIVMLSRLPFPSFLSRVEQIASAHHETLDGAGYPRRLTQAEMDVPQRILAVADIFEALTAADRPYKKGKTLSEALAIMSKMRDAGHICADVFALFVESGLPTAYGREYLRADQVDVGEAGVSRQPEAFA